MSNSLTARDRQFISAAFNQGGYVLDFNNNSFASFTLNVVGVSIKDKYGLSKGQSLECYFDDCSDADACKLLAALIMYKKDNADLSGELLSAKDQKLLDHCQAIVDRLSSFPGAAYQENALNASSFNSEYISKQVELMYASVDSNPTEAIGKAKELIESCCKTVLVERNVEVPSSAKYGDVVSKALKVLELNRDSVPGDKKASETIKRILSGLSNMSNGINELRNDYGTGHGRPNSYSGLTPRHARLAVGVANTFVLFVWDTHCWKKEQEKLRP